MGRIAEGKAVLIDWLRKMETTAFIAFMLPNGNTLLRFQDVPIVNSAIDVSWGTSRLAPFAERFDAVIDTAMETGCDLVYHATAAGFIVAICGYHAVLVYKSDTFVQVFHSFLMIFFPKKAGVPLAHLHPLPAEALARRREGAPAGAAGPGGRGRGNH